MNNKTKLEILYIEYSQCSDANPLYINFAKQFVSGYGNAESSIMFIGEAPGAEEELTGKPFQGRSGKLLRTTLEKYDFNNSNIYITNIVKFRLPQNRTPEASEIKNHKIILDKEIDIIQPKIIITVGSIATNAIIINNILGITKIRGRKFEINNIIVIPIFHPAYILRNKNMFSLFEKDISFIRNIYLDCLLNK